MQRVENRSMLLFLIALSGIGLGFLIFMTSPVQALLPLLPLFFILLFLLTTTMATVCLGRIRWGIFVGIGIVAFFLLRFLKLTHPFYFVVLLLILLLLELALRDR